MTACCKFLVVPAEFVSDNVERPIIEAVNEGQLFLAQANFDREEITAIVQHAPINRDLWRHTVVIDADR